MAENRDERAHFYGRRKGKSLRAGQAERLATLLPVLSVSLQKDPPDDLTKLFRASVNEVWLEIGFGGGEHLLHDLRDNDHVGIIGVEPFVNGMAKFLTDVDIEQEQLLDRIRLFDDDARFLLNWLPDQCLSRINVLYPDPWPKTRHWKRRFLNDEQLGSLSRVLRSGGEFRFASDIESYVNWVLERMRRQPAFEWTAASASDWQDPFSGWPGTRYEQKAIREGRTPAYFQFRRL